MGLPTPVLARARAAAAAVLGAALALVTACGSTSPPAAAGADNASGATAADHAAVIDGFLAGYFQRWPVTATNVGAHDWDGAWPDLSAAGLRERDQWLASVAETLATMKRDSLTVDQRVDLDIIANEIRLGQFVLRVERPYHTNPLSYSYLLGGGLDGLVERDYAPIASRAEALARRLEALPVLVDQAIANLADAGAIKQPHARVAVGQLGGVKSMISDQIPGRVAAAPAELRARIDLARPAAMAAIDRLIAHVEAALPSARGAWRLGKDNFAQKLAMTLQTQLTADQVYELAVAEHAQVRMRMDALARELYQPLFGKQPPPRKAPGSPDHGLIRAVLDALAEERVAAEDLRDACAENLARLDGFVRQAGIVPLDAGEVLEVIWTPPHRRGVAVAGLDAPPPLDAKDGLPSYYLVQPVPPDWPAARKESLLREYNHFMLEILSIHEAIPGHFIQGYYARRNPSAVRKVFWNGPFVEGWAVYTERVMVDAGYVGKRPEGPAAPAARVGLARVKSDDALRARAIALHGQKFYLRAVTNAMLDHEIHARDMTEDQAIELMMERAFQEEGEARGKWVRAQVTSTQLSTYFVGATAWFSLRRHAEQRAATAGQPFDMAEFHRAALSHGSPPLARLPELLGWR